MINYHITASLLLKERKLNKKLNLTGTEANKVYDILIEHADASDDKDSRYNFVHYHAEEEHPLFLGSTGWRFQGNLGFGGEFYASRDEWSVSCYQEDETPERRETIDKVNKLLTELRQRRPI